MDESLGVAMIMLGRVKKLNILILTGLILTACGGGGGSADINNNGSADNTGVDTKAVDDVVEVLENSSVANASLGGTSERSIYVLTNDVTRGAASSLSIISVSSPTKLGGTVTINADKQAIIYIPPVGSNISDFDVFEYVITDNLGNTSTGQVTVTLKTTPCSLNTVLCIGANEEFDTNVDNPETVFQAVIDAAKPGDVIKIRGGTYQHNAATSITDIFWKINVSGTFSQPIGIESYNNETVIFKGFGFPEGTAGPSRAREVLMQINGDYINVSNLEFTDSAGTAIEINGSFGTYKDITTHDSWGSNIVLGAQDVRVDGNVLRNIETYRSRHGYGIILYRYGITNANHLLINNLIEDSLAYDNGYQPDGNKVPAVTGDPAGGGNSDGIIAFKICHDDAASLGVETLCPSNIIRGNVAWHNADDGFDFSFGGGSKVENNISFNNGPEGNRGYKGLRYINGGYSIIGNIALGNGAVGFEHRLNDEGYIHHNMAISHVSHGITAYVTSPSPAKYKVYNNLSTFLDGRDFDLTAGGDNQTNWSEDSMGNPYINDPTFTVSSVNTDFPPGLSISEKVEYIRNQFKNALSPIAGSPLIDAGTFISGVHCATADDDAMTPMAADADCRHWKGSAPDIGPYEY